MNFRTYRKQRGWSLDEAAKMLGLRDGSTVAKHEIGACYPSVETLQRYEMLTDGKVTSKDFVLSREAFRADPAKARRRVGARTIAPASKVSA